MLRQLIVNADDFGYTPGVSRGIIRAHNEGIVTSASVMINMPGAAEWIAVAQDEAPELGLGLHLNLTAGLPTADPADVPDLVDDNGHFYSKMTLLHLLPTLNLEQIAHELRAQVTGFEDAAGHPPDHLDSHHHITYFSPSIAGLMLDLAGEVDIPVRRPIPGSVDDKEPAERFLKELSGDGTSDAFIAEMVNILGSYTISTDVRTPDAFIYEFYGKRAILGELLLLLLDVGEGVTELMCHPAEVDDDLKRLSGYVDRRADELSALTHPSTRELINSEFIQLITFGEMTR